MLIKTLVGIFISLKLDKIPQMCFNIIEYGVVFVEVIVEVINDTFCTRIALLLLRLYFIY